SVFSDELPHALKTGMIASREMMEIIQMYLKKYDNIPYVIDPVMLANSGEALMDDDAKANLKNILLPYVTRATHNVQEAEEITGITINDQQSIYQAGNIFINEIGSKGVVIKRGHSSDKNTAIDYLFTQDDLFTFEEPRYDTKHTHGTGCTFSA